MIFVFFLIAFIGLWTLLNYLLKKITGSGSETSKAERRPAIYREDAVPAEPIIPVTNQANQATNGLAYRLANVIKNYPSGDKTIKAVDIPKLIIRKGEFLAIMGRSGSGKTTLLNLLGTLDKPTSGVITLDGQDLSTLKEKDYPKLRGEKIGFVFQEFNLIPTLTAQENVELPLRYSGLPKEERTLRATEALQNVGLGDRLEHYPKQLSGGENQRVTIARALVREPAVVLADEPTGEVDSQTSRQIVAQMRALNKQLGTTIIIVTHDPAVARATDRILTIQDGCLQEDRVPTATASDEELS